MNQLEEQFKSVKATIEMEGMEVSDEVQRIVLKEASGEISFHEFKKQIMRLQRK
ncbi:antitoxin VbhA family protein [Thalassobacillus hwangdonensis]|uniref:Antitoxin VbhA family protein n=1 Tax=Thalassobacillus hwangdonensis TaxID=546108 RepID=A0ABW3KVL2_9BACI